MQSTSPIGVFDSGIGGLTVASAIANLLPHEQILYFGDTARCPYGDRHPTEVIRFSCQIVDFLVELGVKMVVVACNTATAVALPVLQKRYNIPVIGVIEPGSRAALLRDSAKRIGVIGTAVTISTGAYETTIHRLNPAVEVFSLACPRFVPLVEKGLTDGSEIEEIVCASLAPLVACDLDSLILGCTHYPLLSKVISKIMGPSVQLISSAEETARQVARMLERESGLHPTSEGHFMHQYFTTGESTQMAEIVKRWNLELPGALRNISEIREFAPPKVI